jgi:serine/threonine-protein kinase RsbW
MSFHMPNQIEAIDPMVLTLKSHVDGALSGEALFRFDICLSEALANLVIHAETTDKSAPITVKIRHEAESLSTEIFDPKGAVAFDIRDKARALDEIDALAENGRGLGLILECADQVDYGPAPEGNRLKLTFKARG